MPNLPLPYPTYIFINGRNSQCCQWQLVFSFWDSYLSTEQRGISFAIDDKEFTVHVWRFSGSGPEQKKDPISPISPWNNNLVLEVFSAKLANEKLRHLQIKLVPAPISGISSEEKLPTTVTTGRLFWTPLLISFAHFDTKLKTSLSLKENRRWMWQCHIQCHSDTKGHKLSYKIWVHTTNHIIHELLWKYIHWQSWT